MAGTRRSLGQSVPPAQLGSALLDPTQSLVTASVSAFVAIFRLSFDLIWSDLSLCTLYLNLFEEVW